MLGDGPEDVLRVGQRLGGRLDDRFGLPAVGQALHLRQQHDRFAVVAGDRGDQHPQGARDGTADVDRARPGSALDPGLDEGRQDHAGVVDAPQPGGPQGTAEEGVAGCRTELGDHLVAVEHRAVEVDEERGNAEVVERLAGGSGAIVVVGAGVVE